MVPIIKNGASLARAATTPIPTRDGLKPSRSNVQKNRSGGKGKWRGNGCNIGSAGAAKVDATEKRDQNYYASDDADTVAQPELDKGKEADEEGLNDNDALLL